MDTIQYPSIYTLDNGLVINHINTKCKGMFRMEIIVRAGSNDETKEQIGFAHFIEHLMSFFPCDVDGWRDSVRNQHEFTSRSIQLNAWTEPNTVGYYMNGLEQYSNLIINIIDRKSVV